MLQNVLDDSTTLDQIISAFDAATTATAPFWSPPVVAFADLSTNFATGDFANDDTFSMGVNSSLNMGLLANDSNAHRLILRSVSQPSNGSVSITSDFRTVLYTPNWSYMGSDTFVYEVYDPVTSQIAEALVNVSITAANASPIASNDTANTNINQSITVDVLANDTDADNDLLTITDLSTVSNGSASIVSGSSAILVTPSNDSTLPVTFAYTISDGNVGVMIQQLISVVVTVRIVPMKVLASSTDLTLRHHMDRPLGISILKW